MLKHTTKADGSSTYLKSHAIEFSLAAMQSPSNLVKESGYDHRDPLFGSPPYGKSLQLPLYYIESVLCSPRYGAAIDEGVEFYPVDDGNATSNAKPWSSPQSVILLIDRGGCTFVSKVSNY